MRPEGSRTSIACSSKFSRPGWSGRLECVSRAPKARKSDAIFIPTLACPPSRREAGMYWSFPQSPTTASDVPLGSRKVYGIGSDGQG
ncbi:uncharacterized protein BDW43DRAFT_277962 [Aspergillus alliaceus]|uniref:uncharacterized protein n=1 Tax=Petromyces alliaceus TaxID=209559 RepID=UPI0012A41907|nr:uncharacterized protein BDW43DRAFT_277962 [Aspergillus alliaceus]KAB8232927.1 hypothetical protein BDW43DRAFT_277962 [Aspergillus alliaceus]